MKNAWFSDGWICKQTELIAICYINTPDKEIKTVRKKKKQTKNTGPDCSIIRVP